MSRNGKAQIKVASNDPLVVYISKKGRPVGEPSAFAALKKQYPEIPADPSSWIIHYTDHSTRATRRST